MNGITIHAEGLDRAIEQMRYALDSLGGKDAGKVLAKTINQSLARGRKMAAREARKAYTAPIKKLFDNIRLQRARGSSLEGILDLTSGKGVSLIHFEAEPNLPQPPDARPPEGITARTRRDGSRHVWKGKNGGSKSFIMRKKQGGFGVFVRHKRKINPYEMLFGPSPIQALQRKESQEKVAEAIEENFRPSLEQEIDRILAGRN